MPEQTFIAYDGQFPQFIRVAASRSHGPYPDSIQIEIPPTLPADIPAGGTFFLYLLPSNVQEIWQDCLTDSASFRFDASGYVTSLVILDRRWKWKWPAISGHYNVRNPDGSIRNDAAVPINQTEKTPQELATLLLTELGEVGFDVADMPNDSRPEVRWELAGAAQELQALCDLLGCRIVLQRDNQVAIRRAGEGAVLPDGPLIEDYLSFDPANKPDAVAVMFGPDRFQVDFFLEAVGEDFDGTIKPIAELSYRPAGGFQEPEHMEDILGAESDFRRANMERARRTVYRMYRIKFPALVPSAIANFVINDLAEVAPLEPVMCETTVIEGEVVPREAFAYGIWLRDDDADSANVTNQLTPHPNGFTKNHTVVNRSFRLDGRRGIITFESPVWAKDVFNLFVAPATLALRCAVSGRAIQNRALARQFRERLLPPARGTAREVIKRDDLVVCHVPSYGVGFNVIAVDSNLADINQEADRILDQHARKYQLATPQVRRYSGLQEQELDGAIMRISYEESGGGPTTTISRNIDEGSNGGVPFRDKNKLALQRKAEEAGAFVKAALDRGREAVEKLLGL